MKRVHYYSDSNNVYYNLALEEYFVRNINFEYFELLFIYINEPSLVLGKNQNFFQEVHLQSFFNSNYKLARRISGGGTVVHDLGNINFAFFEKHDLKKVNRYANSVGRITEVLNNLNIKAGMNERNAILLENGKKISGSAQFSNNKSILSHLTLLFQSDIEMIDKFIQKNPYSLQTKASPSVRSRIDNLSNHTSLSQKEFIQKCIFHMGFENTLDEKLINYEEVKRLMSEKYSQISFNLQTAANGILTHFDLELKLEKGRIIEIQGIADTHLYVDKLLFPSEIKSTDRLWEKLLY